jgi:hypothetical protein
MYVQSNNEALSRKHCCRGKAISITHFSACVCVYVSVGVCVGARALACACSHVALLIQHATRMRHTVTCCLSGSAIFFDIIS